MRLSVESLHARLLPSTLGSDWGVPVTLLGGYFVPGEVRQQTVAVADAGGSCRVEIADADGNVLLNEIVFDPAFRGGGHAAIVPGTGGVHLAGQVYPPDTLFVVPGDGGGPQVAEFTFDSGTGRLGLSASFFAPFPTSFRGGLNVSSGSLTLGGKPDLFLLPGAGGGAQFVAVDVQTHAVDASFFVAPPTDLSGSWGFTADGGSVQTASGRVAVPVEYPAEAAAPGEVKTRLWDMGTGADVTADMPTVGGPWVG